MDFFGIIYDMKNGKKVPYSKTYFDTLFAAKLGGSDVKTLTGTLPLTFRTSETALRAWTIYGNDFQQEESKSTRLPLSFYTDEDKLRDWTIYGDNTPHNYSATGTLPLTLTTHTAGNAGDWEIRGNDESYQLFPDSVGQRVITIPQASASTSVEIGAITLPAGRYTIHRYQANTLSSVTRNTLLYNVDSGSYVYEMAAANYHLAQGWYSWSITLTQGGLVRFRWWVADNGNEVSSTNFILTKGETTAPDHYIPYQQGVGQRTENLFDVDDYFAKAYVKSNVTFTKSGNDLKITATDTNDPYVNGSVGNGGILGEQFRNCLMAVKADDTLTFSCITSAPIYHFISFVDSDYKGVADFIKSNESTNTFTVPQNCKYILIRFANSQMTTNQEYTISNIMLVKGSTAPAEYILYGYEIPLTINNTPQTFYIGDSPLTAGQSISKTSTGVDITTQVGENTISTTLYNKPSMSITGLDYVGVGEPTNDGWQIPLTVSDGTNTTTVNVPIDAPLTASDTATKTSTGVDIATADGTNTISTTLENKPTMLVNFGYKGAGEHSGDTWEFNFISQANGNQQLTKLTMDKPLRAGETLTSEQAGITIPTYADAENTLSLYPSAAGYGNPEMSITYKGG